MTRTFPGRAAERPAVSSISRSAQSRLWLVFAVSAIGSAYLHELGHCIPAWAHGYPAVPTPAKEYILAAVTDPVQRVISLGGILATVLASLAALWLYVRSRAARASAILAGTLLVPLAYVVRFLVEGRGHDATEFQEAQAALGLSYSGHALDWFFLTALIAISLAWLWKSGARPGRPLLWKCLQGAALGFVLLVGLQVTNNMIFDPIFGHQSRPSGQGPDRKP